MNAAAVAEGARGVEGVSKAVAVLQGGRDFAVYHHGVWSVVVINPGYGAAGGDADGCWTESKVGDSDLVSVYHFC